MLTELSFSFRVCVCVCVLPYRSWQEVRNGYTHSTTIHFAIPHSVGHCSVSRNQIEVAANEVYVGG